MTKINNMEVEITTNLNVEDYKQFSIEHSKKSFIIEFLLSFFIFMGGIIIVLVKENYKLKDIMKLGIFMTAIGALAILLFVAIHYLLFIIKVKKTFNNNEFLREEKKYIITNNEIKIKSKSINEKINLKSIKKVKEGKHTFLIYTSKKNALAIPKRCFDNKKDEKIFKKILISK